MKKKKYFRLINDIGKWSASVGWIFDSKQYFKISNKCSTIINDIGGDDIKIEVSKISDISSPGNIVFATTITIIPPDTIYLKSPKDTLSILTKMSYSDYLNHNFKNVDSNLQQINRYENYKHTLPDLMRITEKLKKIKN